MADSTSPYTKHIFVCTNERINSERSHCGEAHGTTLVEAFKKIIKEKNLSVEMRPQKTGCFHFCESGPMVVVYPEGIYYGKVQVEDVPEIVESHLLKGIPVARLQLNFENKKA